MNNLKLKIRNVAGFLFGGILQNKDNNFSLYNRQENEILTEEFYICHSLNLVNNQLRTFDKLKQYVAKKDRIKSEEEQRRSATSMYIKYKEAGYIDSDYKLLKGVDIAITEYIS